jgi:signal transduction histidine kinase
VLVSCDDWLVGGGEMAKLIKAKDWSTTPLGPIHAWPQSLRSTVSLVQAASFPISLAWGPGHTQIYNDAYWPLCGPKHPVAMGQDFRECWAEAFPQIGEGYIAAWSGRTAHLENMRFFLDRSGFPEECWFTYSFSPITNEAGKIAGVFHPVTEVTRHMLSERRTRSLHELARYAAKGRTAEEALALAAEVLDGASLDVPFIVLYLVDAAAHRARRVAMSGIAPGAAGPAIVNLDRDGSPWRLAEAFCSGETRQLDDVLAPAGAPVGPYPELPRHTLVLPIRQGGSAAPVALAVAGVSARSVLDHTYRLFFELMASAIGSALASVRTRDEERRKTEALAELEAFNYSVSHDLRSPLRAIEGFSRLLAEGHAAQLDAEGHDYLERVRSGAQRMSELIQDLLALSRVGRGELRHDRVDLSAIARHVTDELRARDPDRAVDVRVADGLVAEGDERLLTIALENLLGNAWKFTAKRPRAVITVDREASGAFVVRDNGAGFDMAHAARLFEPFCRLHSETEFEGTGIGLAIVRRIIERHRGRVWALGEIGGGAAIRFTLGDAPDEAAGSARRGAPPPL